MVNGQRLDFLSELVDVLLDGSDPVPHPAGFYQGASGRIDTGEESGHGVRSHGPIQLVVLQPLSPFPVGFLVRLRRSLLFFGCICEALFLETLPTGRIL